ncbi:MAG: GIY-YIG nuclease family protein [Nitrospirota bacterium]|nr:GIY-YIG nuclease family protein [Nitrospirota bacterium]
MREHAPPSPAPPERIPTGSPITYRLFIHLPDAAMVRVGRLGAVHLAAGDYIYTGSARRGLSARVLRHLGYIRRTPRWHIDFFLETPGCRVERVDLHREAECTVNQATPGTVPVPGFGASDCTAGCHSHLKYTGHPASWGPGGAA